MITVKSINFILTSCVATIVVTGGLLLFPALMADRVMSPVAVGGTRLLGVPQADVPALLQQTAREISEIRLPLEFRGQSHTAALADLGIALDIPATAQKVFEQSRWPWRSHAVSPELAADKVRLVAEVNRLFRSQIKLPQNASLAAARAGKTTLLPARPGETPDILVLIENIHASLSHKSSEPVLLHVIPAEPEVLDSEVSWAQELTEKLLAHGFTLQFEDKSFVIARGQLVSLLQFVEQVDPQNLENHVLGVRLEPEKLRAHLEKQIAPEINQKPVDAKFEIHTAPEEENRVTQFAAPERGLTLNLDATAQEIARAAASGAVSASLIVDVVEPAIAENTDIEKLGVTALLAHGESDFAGSPRNRIHNITVGTALYHGLLIAPGEEFSFNDHLGPVNAAAGFKPELVIKGHSTVPEFGGGLCQVSTTAFRAAIFSGLEITARKSHAYAVRYYGTPGFDATIYPGYTDLRFRNNTPGHILVQTKIEGAKLTFEFWGTPDGRTVEVVGPNPYSRRPDGAVKATLAQKVIKEDQVIIDETFQSNYRSPALFPRPTGRP